MTQQSAKMQPSLISIALACCLMVPARIGGADVCGKPSKESWEGECSKSAVGVDKHTNPHTRTRTHTQKTLANAPHTKRAYAVNAIEHGNTVRGRWAAGASRRARAFTCLRTAPSKRARYVLYAGVFSCVCGGCGYFVCVGLRVCALYLQGMYL